MLPSIANRPLSIVRCPDGTGHQCFFQKHVTNTLPPGIGSVDVADKNGKVEPYITLSTQQALAGLAQIGVLEIHPWGSTNDNLEHPDRIIIDLDPDISIPWPTLAASALEVRAQLKKTQPRILSQEHRRQRPPHRHPHRTQTRLAHRKNLRPRLRPHDAEAEPKPLPHRHDEIRP